jgi:rubrerythrin
VIEDVRMPDEPAGTTGDFVHFHAAGQPATGAFRCSDCGYGVAVSTVLPQCPMCAGRAWEEELRRMFGLAERISD